MISIITRIQIEANNTVSFLNGTNYVQGMSQVMPQVPTYISYGYDSISITQDGSKTFQFSVYTVTDVGGNSFAALTFQDPATTVQDKTIEIYRLLVTSIFKGCCECGSMGPECAIQYVAGDPGASTTSNGEFVYASGSPGSIAFNYITGNNQDFTNFFPTVQDGSWIFLFSKTDPTVYAIVQVSGFVDQVTQAKFDAIELNATGVPFTIGTIFCVDFTSVGGSLVQGWQDTLDINSVLDKDNTVDGAGYNFVFDNNASFVINSAGGSVETNATGASLNAGTNEVLVTTGYIDIITPGHATAGTGWVLAKTAAGHVEYVEAGTGTISSIGLNMPPAFTVSTPNPLTSNGSFTVDGAGTALQYINGLGELATVPVYTVENGLHTKESPANPNVFHLGGQLIEATIIDTNEILSPTTNNEWQLSIRANKTTVNNGQDTQFPLGVANLGNGGVATFQDYGSGSRPNPSVEIVGDVDLLQPLLELTMEGNLPDANNTMLRLRYSGRPDLATTTIDYQFRNNNAVAANSNFIGSRLSTEVVNFVDNNEQTRFNLQLMEGGDLANKLQVQGYGQFVLNEYGLNVFSNGASNINNALDYVLAVDASGNVYKKFAEGGGTVTEIDATGLLTTSPDPITTTGTVSSEMNSGFLVGRYDAGVGVFQEITVGTGLTLSATGELSADGSVPAYDGDQGVYKDTSLTNDTFTLGAPSGSQGTIPFTIDRFIDVDDFRLQMEGLGGDGILVTKDGGAALPLKLGIITSVTDNLTPAGIFISENFDAFEVYTYGVDTVAAKIANEGTGPNSYAADFSCINGHGIFVNSSTFNTFQINTLSASNNSIDNVIYIAKRPTSAGVQGEGTSIAMSPGNDWNNVDIPIGATLNCVVSDPGASGRDPIPATVDFRVDTNRLGVIIEHTSFIGNGQLRLHEYGQTPAQFYDPAPVWALGVDVNGNVVEIAAGGGPGTTYTVDNGLTEDPANNFQLGGPLVQDTTITGAANSWTLNINELSAFNSTAKGAYNFNSTSGGSTGTIVLSSSDFRSEVNDGLDNTYIEQFSATLDTFTTGTTTITSGGSTNIRSGSGYSNYVPQAGVGATVYATHDMSAGYVNMVTRDSSGANSFNEIFMKSTNGGSRHININSSTGGSLVGLHIGIANSFSASIPTILFSTPNVSNGSAVVGQVLTLKSMTGTDRGRVEFEDAAPPGTTYTVDNGLTEDPANNFQLGGPLVTDTAIDGGTAYGLYFTDIRDFLVTTGIQVAIQSNNGISSGQLRINPTGDYTRLVHQDIASGDFTSIELTSTELRVQTPLFSTKSAGDVLTLIDPATGESEWGTPSAAGGGAGGRSYYLNGGTNQGTFVGNTYYEMSPVPVVGTNADFVINTNGYIASFITDAGDPNQTVIPAGNWNFEMWFSANTAGGTPSFYVQLSKYDTVGGTFTPIATSAGSPEGITNGGVIDLYVTALEVPQTPLASTDRLAIRVWVNHSSKTITLHTQDSHLCQIITTFASGIVSLNGLTASVQTMGVGTTGTDFGISSASGTHTFNLPTASAANRGALSSADWSIFNGKQNNIGLTSVGTALATLPNPSAIRYLRINADNTATAISAATLKSELLGATPYGVIAYGSGFVATVPASTTTYAMVTAGLVAFNTNIANREFVIPFGGTVKNLYVFTSNTQGAGGSLVISVMQNSVATSLAVTVPASGLSATRSNLIDSFTAVAGDKLVFRLVNNHTNVSAVVVSVSFIIEQL